MVEVFIQRLNGNDEPIYTYVADNMLSFSLDLNTPVSAMPLPQQTAADQILVKVEGNSAVINFSWTISDKTDSLGSTIGSVPLGLRKITCSGGTPPANTDIGKIVQDDGANIGYLVGIENTNIWLVATNKSPVSSSAMTIIERNGITAGVGSQTSGAVEITQDLGNFLTVGQQISFFYTTFQPQNISDKFRIRVNDTDGTPFEEVGFFHTQGFRIAEDAPVTYTGNVTFFIGDNIVAFEDDVPGPPTGVGTSSPTSSSFTVSWTAPNNIGGSALSDYRVYYRKQGETQWLTTDVGGTGTSKSVTGLNSNTLYEVRVSAKNTAGFSPKSTPVILQRTS